jgi:MbtH protein
MTAHSPFDRAGDCFVVLVNQAGQCSLWPAAFAVPTGWTVVHTAGSRAAAVAYVDEQWTDLRPRARAGSQP